MRGVQQRLFRFLRSMVFLCSALALVGGVAVFHAYQSAISAELSPLETRVLGQNRWLCGGPAALRVIVSDHRTGGAVSAKVEIALLSPTDDKAERAVARLYSGKTNKQGTVDAQFTLPTLEPGSYRIQVLIDSTLGRDEVVQPITVEEAVQVMLSSDKPLYQPGQTMHLRALALNLATRKAVVRTPITFEVEDARGNKVFKQREESSDFGTAGVDFVLASEVNMGAYTVRAILPQGQTEKKIRVERYVLPKFKIALTTEKPYYLPGEVVLGTVQADYFFGKPVANSTVTVEISTMDIGVNKLGELKGKTDANGTFKFEYTLPKAFVGQPFEQGKAVVEFHGIVLDNAQHTQETFTSIPVVKDPILIAVVAESRQLVPKLKNRIFIAVASPDGRPLRGVDIAVAARKNAAGETGTVSSKGLKTDALGLAVCEVIPAKNGMAIEVTARTADGQSASTVQSFEATPTEEGIILRSSHSIAKVGDRMTVAAISSTKRGTIYLDVVRNKQTILTKAMPAVNGQASVTIPVTHDMVGTLELHAYKILPNEDIIRDTQIVIATPADDLLIDVKANMKEYRPGEEATLSFTITDQQRHPVFAALGLAVVDESVFALSEFKPGLEKIYFTLEKELMEPKYEIHGLTPTGLMLPVDPGQPILLKDRNRQLAAEVLFAAVPAQSDFNIKVNTYQQRWEAMKQEVVVELNTAHQKFAEAVNAYRQKTGTSLTAEQSLFHLVDTGYLKIDDLKDRWGTFYQTDLRGAKTYDGWFTLKSAGPDTKWNTNDDFSEEDMWRVRRGGKFELMPGAPGPMGMAFGVAGAAPPMVMEAVMDKATTTSIATGATDDGSSPVVRIREYFPETMYWNPLLITDQHGRAEISIPVADSITTWRMSMLANTPFGQLGSTTASMRVFQPFFADIDLPIALTQNDSVAIPVAVYNYLPDAQDVTLRLDVEPWFTLQGQAEQTITLAKGEVNVVYFPITVTGIGHYSLTVHADGTGMSDAVRRTIDVLPDGKEVRTAINDRLEGKVEKTVTIPAEAIDGASNIWVKLYPGSFSQVVEGLDGILRMPSGCFEQTSSTTYPNVLVLDYMKATKKINPELQMKAEQYINTGYQRLVTYECKNGGFSWFGDEPAHQILTAYGLLEFSDMARVHEVDPALIQRTQVWLANQQKGDGTWEVGQGGIAEGIINRQTGTLRSTAYIAWALAESSYQGPQVAKAVQYVKAHRGESKDPYTLGVILNLLTRVDRDSRETAEVAQSLIDSAKVTDKTAYWESDTKTFTGATKDGADLETTGLAAYGLVKWGRNSGFTNKVLTHLTQSKDSFGTWSSTQGTVWSLKALLLASTGGGGGGKGKVTVLANGQPAATFDITEENSDVMRQVDLTQFAKEGDNAITLEFAGEGSPLYQIVTRYYLPWDKVEQRPELKGPLSIGVNYDKTTLAADDTATVTVTIKNETNAIVEMPLIDVGVPPGFTVDPEKLDAAVQNKQISKYTVAARQIIIYMEKLDPGATVTLTYKLKAKYPIKARTPQSLAYPYYNPENATVSAPQQVTVQ